MLDVASLKASAEAITVEFATVVLAAVEESAVAAAAVTMMGMVGGGDNSGKPHVATSLGLRLRLLVW